MGPELVRFYGGTPQQWEATPWSVARRYYEAIPRVRRREQPDRPAPALAPAPSPVSAPRKQPSVAELRAKLAGMGIAVEEAPRG